MTPLPADQALERYFFEARCKLLDVAAILDRVGRGECSSKIAEDPRLAKIRKALDVLQDSKIARAERIQQIFSLEYDPSWGKPKPA